MRCSSFGVSPAHVLVGSARFCATLAALSLLLMPGVPLRAQEPETPQGAADEPLPEYAPDDPTVPAGAVRAFIDACRAGDYAKAAERLNLASLPPDGQATEGPRLARQLKIVLDQKLWIHYEQLSDRPEGDLDDGLPPSLEQIGTIRDGIEVDVLLKRMEVPGGAPVWRFAASTVRSIPALYDEFGYGAIGEFLPRSMFEISFLEILLVQWIGLAMLVALAWIVARIAVWILLRVVRPIAARTESRIDERLLALMTRPLRFLVALGAFMLGVYLLRLSEPAHEFLSGVLTALAVLGLTWIAMRLVDVGVEVLSVRLDRAGRASAKAILPMSRRTAKTVLFALALVMLLQNLGFNVTGLIAGLGVGGLAAALAAQKSIENLFGGVTLVTDQPVRVGDFCRFGSGQLGTVEEIGMRSTRIRTLDRTVVSVPNSQFSEFQLENFAPRDRVRLVTSLGLRYETTPDQLRYVLVELRKTLIGHPRVAEQPLRVRFSGFGAHSLDVEVYTMIDTADYNEFCAIREDLFLRFMDVVAAAGTGFAFPSQTLYLGRDGGLDEDRGTRAAQAVQNWRQAGELPFPDLSAEETAGLRDRSDYPPTGSVARTAG